MATIAKSRALASKSEGHFGDPMASFPPGHQSGFSRYLSSLNCYSTFFHHLLFIILHVLKARDATHGHEGKHCGSDQEKNPNADVPLVDELHAGAFGAFLYKI